MARTQPTTRSTDSRGREAAGADAAAAPRTRGHIAHHVPGRLRIKVAAAAPDEEEDFFDAVQHLFTGLPGVQDVRVARSSRSIVVLYDAADVRFAERLPHQPAIAQLLHLVDPREFVRSLDEAVEMGLHYAQRHSRLAEAIVSGAEDVDTQLRRVSDGYLDLKLLLPLGVAAATTLRRARREGTPMWMTLGTFAFNAFMSLHRNRIDGPTIQPGSDPAAPPPRARRR